MTEDKDAAIVPLRLGVGGRIIGEATVYEDGTMSATIHPVVADELLNYIRVGMYQELSIQPIAKPFRPKHYPDIPVEIRNYKRV